MPSVHYRTVSVNDLEFFLREAGPQNTPVVPLLHGYPACFHIFCYLIPALVDQYRVVASDHIGFGRSFAPLRTISAAPPKFEDSVIVLEWSSPFSDGGRQEWFESITRWINKYLMSFLRSHILSVSVVNSC